MKKLNLPPLKDKYLERLKVLDYSEATIKDYNNFLKRFFIWCGQRGVEYAFDISFELLENYQRYLSLIKKTKDNKKLSNSHIIANLSCIKMFLRFLVRRSFIRYNPADNLEYPKIGLSLPKNILTIEEITRILEVSLYSDKYSLRDKALLELCFSCGLRSRELFKLNVLDCNFEKGEILIRTSKNKNDRIVPLSERVEYWLLKYIEELRDSLLLYNLGETALFLDAYGRRFSRGGLSKRVKGIYKKAGIDRHGCNLHSLRHSCATLMLKNGADIRIIQDLLGHSKLDTTKIYTKVDISLLKNIHNKTHPLG